MSARVDDMPAALSPRDKAALRRRYPIAESLRFSDDPAAVRFVADHPDGASLDAIGALYGCTRENIRQVEEKALRNFTRRLRLLRLRTGESW